MRFLAIPALNLRRRPARSLLTIAGIAVAVASFIALIGMSRALEKAWVSNFLARGTHMLAMRKGAVELLTASIQEQVTDDLRRFEGVKDVAGELVDLVSLEPEEVVLVTGWAPGSYLWETLEMLEGDFPEPDASQVAFLGQSCAEALELGLDDTIRIHGADFSVAGVFRQGGVMGNSTILLPLRAMQDLLERPDVVTEFNLLVDRPDDAEWVAGLRARLDEAFPELVFTETTEIANNNEILRLFRAMAWGTSCIALVIALVVILNTLLMTVTERTREIGVLSAVGWSSERILAMIVLEGLLLAMLGSVAGSALGVGGLRYLAELPNLRGFLQPEVTLRLLLEVTAATLALGVLGGLYPALRAVRANTVDALRYE